MELFWRQGYEATSLQNLTDGLGVGKGSFYAAFGSKDKLYGAALERYCSSQTADLIARLDQADEVLPALRAALYAMVDADTEDPQLGCLLVKAATERSGDAETIRTVHRAMNQVEASIASALERAKMKGELGQHKDPVALARFFTTFIQGQRVIGGAPTMYATLHDAVDVALSTLD